MIRKSILSVKNLELPRNQEEIQNNLETINKNVSPRPSVFKNNKTDSKKSPRSSLQIKINRLKDMKLTNLFEKHTNTLSGFSNSPRPNICISELWGSKEKYLKKTGYLNAYNELKKKNEFDKFVTTKSSRKIEKPHANDLFAQKQSLLTEKKQENPKLSPLNTIFEVKEAKKGNEKESEIDQIIKKCSELSKKAMNFKLKTNKIQKMVQSYSEKQSSNRPKLKGLSSSTSSEIFNSYKKFT